MAKVINCVCGVVVTGRNDEELVANAREHGREAHPGWPDAPDEEILASATPAD